MRMSAQAALASTETARTEPTLTHALVILDTLESTAPHVSDKSHIFSYMGHSQERGHP